MKVGSARGAPSLERPSTPAKPATGGPRSFVQVLRAGDREVRPAGAPARPRSPTPKPSPPAAPPSEGGSPIARGLARALEGAAKGEARIDALLEAAAKGKTFTAAELLAMQATVFRYSQTVEVLSRATDRLVGAIKQTLGTQV
jgi:hypothetical protein